MKRAAHFGNWRFTLHTVALALFLNVGAASSRADIRPQSGAWLIGFELQQRSFETMSVGDARPTTRADAGVRGSIECLLAPGWMVGVSAHYGGSWFDWSDRQLSTAGKIEDAAWDVRFGLDRVLPLGAGGMFLVGAGIEYGEAHSWVHTLGPAPPFGQDIDDEGPRCYRTGGFARMGVITPMWRRLALCAEVSNSIYGAHASDPQFGTQFNWLGKSLAVSAGLRFQVAGGHAGKP